MTAAVVAPDPAAPRRDPATILLAALLPPLGVWRAAGGAGRDFWITCGLTVLGFLPGAAFALHQVLLGKPR